VRLVTQKEARTLFGGEGSFLETFAGRVARARSLAVVSEERRYLPPGAELGHWIELFARFELEVADPAESELRAPGATPGLQELFDPRNPSWIAELLSVFTASTVIAQQDAMSFLASWVGSRDGASRVYYFHPGDWGMWPTDASIAARMFRLLQEEDRPGAVALRYEGTEEAWLTSALKLYEATAQDALPELSDPGRLFRRSEWLVGALTGAGRAIRVSLTGASTIATFLAEADLIPRLPHIACYWLWAHFLLENDHELDVTMALSESVEDSWVQGSRRWMEAWRTGSPQALGTLDPVRVQGVREALAQEAPVELFGPDRRRSIMGQRTRELSEAEAEAEVRAPLEEAAAKDGSLREVLALFDHLSGGGPMPPHLVGASSLDAARALTEAIDPRFKRLVQHRLLRSGLHADGHQLAGCGLVLAWAKMAESVDEYESFLERVGTGRFGPRRKAELYEGYGRFSGPRATEALAAASTRWLQQSEDWIRQEPPEAVLVLLQRDTLVTHQFIARLLEHTKFSFANVDVCVEAARAAGRIRSTRAAAGLRRAVEHRLGRVGDGGRTDVNVALAQVELDDASDFFAELVDRTAAAWEAADDADDAWGLQMDLSCHLAGSTRSDPGEARYVALARMLVERLAPRLIGMRAPGPETIEVATALLMAAHRLEELRLVSELTELGRSFRKTAGNRKAAERFDAVQRQWSEELES
jgi:hypothetical protein